MELDTGLTKAVLMIFSKAIGFMPKPGKKGGNRLPEIEEVILLAYGRKMKNDDLSKVFFPNTIIDTLDTDNVKSILAHSEAPLLKAAFLIERSGDIFITNKGLEYIDGMSYEDRIKLEQKYKLADDRGLVA